MAEMSLSVVMPVRDEAPHLTATIAALLAALEGAGFAAELIVVDDGSKDASVDVVRAAVADLVPLRVVTQQNRGRFEARLAGVRAAEAEMVLLLDARVRLAGDALRFARTRLEAGEAVWNAHVHIETDNPFGIFWRLLAELVWRDYFDHPRTTSYGSQEFDRYPKGTTCFLAPRSLLSAAMEAFTTRYADIRLANDDTPLLRLLVEREPICISPRFACVYVPRTSMRHFLRHSFHRGVVFLDGHGTPASRFFPLTLAFFPASAVLVLGSLRRPGLLPAALAVSGLAAAGYGFRARRSRREIETLALLTPVYVAGHGLGMWRGLGELVRARLAR